MRINFNNAKKLRSGHTVWRCMAGTFGVVHVHEFLLAGRKVHRANRAMVETADGRIKFTGKVHDISTKIVKKREDRLGNGNYLNDIHGHGSKCIAAFTTRREAMRWKREVEAGLHPDVNLGAIEHMFDYDFEDDYYGDYEPDSRDPRDSYDYYDPHSAAVAEEMY